MKLKLLLIFTCITLNIYSQESKFIDVTGSAEMSIEPDEFIFIIEIEEYWEEEFQKNKKVKNFKNKIDILTIESQLLKDLETLGISSENVKSTDIGNTWKYSGKKFLISKELEITLSDFRKINQIVSKLDRKGIENMKIGELKHHNISKLRKEVKIEAIRKAKEKAKYLLEAVDEEIGGVISIIELSNQNSWWKPASPSSNSIMGSYDNPNKENGKKIKLRFEIKARFEIK